MRSWQGTLTFLGAAVLGGCLFPSFDDLGGTGKRSTKDTSSGDSGPASDPGTSSSSGTSVGTSSGTTALDAGPGEVVVCGTVSCPVATQLCCLSVGGSQPNCQGLQFEGTCELQLGGDEFKCDGNEDCPSGQLCCVNDGDSACASTCAGKTLCNAPNSTCPAGKTCTGSVSGFKACQ